MLVTGARGHAKEILQVLEINSQAIALSFFDNVNADTFLFDQYPILRTLAEVEEHFTHDPRFILGTGNPLVRRKFTLDLETLGGVLTSVICQHATIGKHEVILGEGLNIMHSVFISNSVTLARGVLVNRGTSIHHDVRVGEFAELSPGCQLLGGCHVGAYSCIGAGAIILPRIKIGMNATIGAGAVVTADVPDNFVMAGVPARKIDEKAALTF